MTTIKASYFHRDPNWSRVNMPLTEDEVKTWIADLRSGKYEQGQEQLCDDTAYCCLGVLAKTQGLFDNGLFKPTDGTLEVHTFREGPAPYNS